MKKLGLLAVFAAVGAWFVAGSRRQKVVGKFTSVATRTLQPKEYDDATLKDLYVVTARDQRTTRFTNRLWTKIKTGQ